MGNQLIWNEQYNIGVDIIDKEHRKLFGILNKLFDFRRQDEKSQWGCHEAVKFFREHALQHFADEEAYMESVGYAGLETHRRIHKNFRERTLPALEKELERTKYTEDSINHFIGVCAGWLIGHTLVEDHAIVSGETVKQWENLLPEEEQAVMGQTIAGLLHAMFRLDAKLISACYGGEKFGDGVYCRLIYRTGGKKKCEYFLVFEEKLIAGMIGGVMDIPSEAVDVMRMHVEEYVAKRFVEHASVGFASGGRRGYDAYAECHGGSGEIPAPGRRRERRRRQEKETAGGGRFGFYPANDARTALRRLRRSNRKIRVIHHTGHYP